MKATAQSGILHWHRLELEKRWHQSRRHRHRHRHRLPRPRRHSACPTRSCSKSLNTYCLTKAHSSAAPWCRSTGTDVPPATSIDTHASRALCIGPCSFKHSAGARSQSDLRLVAVGPSSKISHVHDNSVLIDPHNWPQHKSKSLEDSPSGKTTDYSLTLAGMCMASICPSDPSMFMSQPHHAVPHLTSSASTAPGLPNPSFRTREPLAEFPDSCDHRPITHRHPKPADKQ